MLHILLLLLKVLGILFLALSGIFLLIVIVVLLVPVRYRGNASFHGEPEGTVLVSWLFCILRVRLVLDESLKLSVKVLWLNLFEEIFWSKNEDEKKRLSEDDGSKKDLPGEEPTPESLSEENFGEVLPDFEEEELEMVHMAELSGKEIKEEQGPEEKSGLEEETNQKKVPALEEKRSRKENPALEEKTNQKEKPGLGERLCSFCKKLKEISMGGQSSLKKARKKYDGCMAFIEDEENQKTFRLLAKQIKKFFKCILPGHVEGRVRFGFEDPYHTGKVLTIISPFYGLYARTLAVEPVFEEKALEGELKIKGKIRAASILFVGLRLFMNKNFRRLLRRSRKISRKNG